MDHTSARPGSDRAHERVRCGPHPGHSTAVAAVMSPLGWKTWPRGYWRRDWSAVINGQVGEWGRRRKEARGADERARVWGW